MQVIAELSKNHPIARFFELNWQVIPNLAMDIIVPPLAHIVNVYRAGQVFLVSMFVVIISGILMLNRALIGRFSVLPLFAIPLLYNYVFLVGLMNYIFGIGVAIWALSGWVALRERAWPIRFALSSLFVVVLFFCHLSALGIYGIGLLSAELLRLWERRAELRPRSIADFLFSGAPFLIVVPLLYASPTMQLCRRHVVGATRQARRVDIYRRQLFRYCRFCLDRDLGGQRGLGNPAPGPEISSIGFGAACCRRRHLFCAATRNVRHLHD